MEGRLAAFIIWTIMGVLFIVMGIYDFNSKKAKPFGFWANAEAAPIEDVKEIIGVSLYLKGANRMEATVKKNYAETLEQHQIGVRQCVMNGVRQTREGKTKDFNTVCDRLEKKYISAKV